MKNGGIVIEEDEIDKIKEYWKNKDLDKMII